MWEDKFVERKKKKKPLIYDYHCEICSVFDEGTFRQLLSIQWLNFIYPRFADINSRILYPKRLEFILMDGWCLETQVKAIIYFCD